MLTVMLNVIMLNVIMLNVIILNIIMLNVIMLNAIIQSVIMLSVAAPFKKDTSAQMMQPCHHYYIRCIIILEMVSEGESLVRWQGHLHFQLVPTCVTYFLEEFLVGHKLKFLYHKVHDYLIHNSCLTHSHMNQNSIKGLYLSHSQLVLSSFISHSQTTKILASAESLASKSPWWPYFQTNTEALFLVVRNPSVNELWAT